MRTTESAATPLSGHLIRQPGDPIFTLAELCRRDPHADKIDLTVGICPAGDGRVPAPAAAA